MSKHVLIVDDEPKVGFFLKEALRRSGQDCQVTVVHSGEQAQQVLERSTVDLLVTDLRMSGISGLDLIRWVRASSPKTRTILITAYGNDDVEAEAQRLEAYRYITKPFDIADFTSAVEEALGKVALMRPGLIVFSDQCFEAVADHLEQLRRELGAQCVFLADMQGQRLVEVGDTEGLNTAALLALLAGGIAASTELARQLKDQQALNLNYHEGARYDVYSATVDEGLFLAMVYDRRVQPSRIGLVWLYTRRAIEQLRQTFAAEETTSGPTPLGDDFGSSLAAELDTWFTEEEVTNPDPVEEIGLPLQQEKVDYRQPSDNLAGGNQGMELLDLETAISRGIIPSNLLSSK